MSYRLPRVVGHRGAAASAPENTLAGIRRAHALGASWVEFDVKLTRDGVAVLMHDDAVDRTTDGTGSVAGMTLEALRRLDAGERFGAAFAGERIPTFAEAIDLVLALDLQANVEIKPCPGRETETGAAVAAELFRRWPSDRPAPLLSSFKDASLEAARTAAPGLPRGLLVREMPPNWRERLRRLDCVSYHCSHRYLDSATIATVHDAGWPVLVYTVNEPERARTLYDWGVDCIVTDRPEAILPVGR